MDNIPHTIVDGCKVITRRTLELLCPAAVIEMRDTADIWIMTEKPVCLNPYTDDGPLEEWTQTNEPELAEWVSDLWDDISIPIGKGRVVILCGSLDDEHGSFWDSGNQAWVDYNF